MVTILVYIIIYRLFVLIVTILYKEHFLVSGHNKDYYESLLLP